MLWQLHELRQLLLILKVGLELLLNHHLIAILISLNLDLIQPARLVSGARRGIRVTIATVRAPIARQLLLADLAIVLVRQPVINRPQTNNFARLSEFL